MTKTSTKSAIADASSIKFNIDEFIAKYDDRIELLDVDNIMDYTDGVVNLIFRKNNGDSVSMLFIDGRLDTVS